MNKEYMTEKNSSPRLLKNSFNFLLENWKLAFFTVFFFFVIYSISYTLNVRTETIDPGTTVYWEEVGISLLRFLAPFIALCFILQKTYNTNKKTIKEILFIPLRFKTYLYSLMLSAVLAFSALVAFQLIPGSFIQEVQNTGSTVLELVQNESNEDIVEQEIKSAMEHIKETLPVYHIGASIFAFFTVFLILFSMTAFSFPLMFSEHDDGVFTNIKTSIILFFTNFKSVLILNTFYVFVFIVLQVIVFNSLIAALLNSIGITLMLFALTSASMDLHKNIESKEKTAKVFRK